VCTGYLSYIGGYVMTEYITPELLILIPCLYIIGLMIKEIEIISNKYIPLILTGVSLVLTSLYVIGVGGFSAINIFSAIVQSILCVACAVYADQIKKQFRK
jgi:phosphoglycerol transferase MdoB-like AlkP superfamily enzyme